MTSVTSLVANISRTTLRRNASGRNGSVARRRISGWLLKTSTSWGVFGQKRKGGVEWQGGGAREGNCPARRPAPPPPPHRQTITAMLHVERTGPVAHLVQLVLHLSQHVLLRSDLPC